MSGQWRDQLAGARMQVDQQFTDRVMASEFSNQQWGLIMTAVDFDIKDPENPKEARLVADTDKLPQIMPELDNVPQGMGGPGAAGGGRGSKSGGFMDRLRSLLGGSGGGVDQEQLVAATDLVNEYTKQLQAFLEEEGRWEALCGAAADSGSAAPED